MRYAILTIGLVQLAAAWNGAAHADPRDLERCKDTAAVVTAEQNIAACSRILGDPAEPLDGKAAAFTNLCKLWNIWEMKFDVFFGSTLNRYCRSPFREGSANSRAFVRIGDVYKGKGDRQRAMTYYNVAIGFDPQNADAFNARGAIHLLGGDAERALSDYAEAIDLQPENSDGFLGRATARRAVGNNDNAMADVNEAIRLDPANPDAFQVRGDLRHEKGENGLAMTDYEEAVRLDGMNTIRFRKRGLAYLYDGSLSAALADLERAVALDPADVFAVLWLDLATQRNHLPTRLPQSAAGVDMTAWPSHLIRMLMGEITTDATLQAAVGPDPYTRKVRLCSANFFIGARDHLTGAKDAAVHRFTQAAAECPRLQWEWSAAREELKALGVQP